MSQVFDDDNKWKENNFDKKSNFMSLRRQVTYNKISKNR